MRILLVEPYNAGSHEAWASGYRTHSSHDVEVLAHEARFWRWRMQGASVTLAREFDSVDGRFDAVLASDMLDLPAFLGHTRRRLGRVPAVLYMHENQLSYPLSEALAEDLTYAMINWRSMVAADEIWFNSEYHRTDVAERLPEFLGRFPDRRHAHLIDDVLAKSTVMPVGVDLDDIGERVREGAPPLILWNHRWEHDKAPEDFISALDTLAAAGVNFTVAFAGENFRQHPSEFSAARRRLGDRVVHFGFAPPDVYGDLLRRSSVVVSTSRHEFFGISITEAVYAGAFPVLPHRLVYPERIPAEFWDRCLYTDQAGLVEGIKWAIDHPDTASDIVAKLRPTMAEAAWTRVAPTYDDALARIVDAVDTGGSP